jgi:hypothetical protein
MLDHFASRDYPAGTAAMQPTACHVVEQHPRSASLESRCHLKSFQVCTMLNTTKHCPRQMMPHPIGHSGAVNLTAMKLRTTKSDLLAQQQAKSVRNCYMQGLLQLMIPVQHSQTAWSDAYHHHHHHVTH